MSKSRNLLIASALVSVLAAPALAEKIGLGRPALPEEIAAWDVTVLPDGSGLPEGSGDVATGEEVFAEKCSSCHGDFAEGIDSWPVLAGGQGTLKDVRPVKTVGSYWPYLSTVFDYVHRSMPFGGAQTVSADEAYAITAFLLYSNGLVEDDFELSKDNFTQISMPNADGFYVDDRSQTEYPQFSAPACMENCIPGEVKVTKRAVELNVTPQDPDGKPAGTIPPIFEVSEAGTNESAAAAPADAGPAIDPEQIAAGEKVFKKCASCHKIGDGAKNGTGPQLNAIIGRKIASVDGFKYSGTLTDMGASGAAWDTAAMDAFIENPKSYAKGTRMSFAGLKSPEDRAALIAYLSSLSP